MSGGWIRITGARQNNLKNIDVQIPVNQVTVITGVSGSGKSSLAIDVLYAEGQRRYVESFSAYARQFLDRVDKPQVDRVEGVLPAVMIGRGRPSRNSRSTVGTVTELQNYLKLLFAKIGTLYCGGCGQEVQSDSPETVEKSLSAKRFSGTGVLVAFDVTILDNLPWKDMREGLIQAGLYRLFIDGQIVDIDGVHTAPPDLCTVVVDRLVLGSHTKQRVSDSLEQAFQYGKGRIRLIFLDNDTSTKFSDQYECTQCGIAYVEPVPNLFSFNSPVGACPTCSGKGTIIAFDPGLVINEALSLDAGAIEPWHSRRGLNFYQWEQQELLTFCRQCGIPTDVPWKSLSDAMRELILYGVEDYGGVAECFQYLTKYHSPMPCSTCEGARLNAQACGYRVGTKSIVWLQQAPIQEVAQFFGRLRLPQYEETITRRICKEIQARLVYLMDVGVGYLSLDRQTSSLSGGERARIALTRALGSALVNTLYVIDEPTIGLHSRDTHKLIGILCALRDSGNTVVVIEHDPDVIRAADYLVDLGPGAGDQGGQLICSGPTDQVLQNVASITAQYIVSPPPAPRRQRVRKTKRAVTIRGATEHNLKDIDIDIPVGGFVCISGVSGSGKSTLLYDVLYRGLMRQRGEPVGRPGACREITGGDLFDAVILVDQAPLTASPRTNLAMHTYAYDHIRDVFAEAPLARKRGYSTSTFSLVTDGGRCPTCRGEGEEQIDMHFLSDVRFTCLACEGRRFRQDVLQVEWEGLNIADALNLTVEQALARFVGDEIRACLGPVRAVGLGYLTLGHPVSKLSGGEAQRLKIATVLTDSMREKEDNVSLLILDEPTTGLHQADIHVLLDVFSKLVIMGHTVVVVEHNLDVLSQADLLIDLGPEGGNDGGYIVAHGSPTQIARQSRSDTGKALAAYRNAQPTNVVRPVAVQSSKPAAIRLVGARENNLKNISVAIPRDELVVVTGLSGSGKSTLAFNIIYREGQRRYLEGLTTYARRFIGDMKQPEVDHLEGIPPTLAVEQRTGRAGHNSTVATLTEVAHYLRLLYAKVGTPYCPRCQQPVTAMDRELIIEEVLRRWSGKRLELAAPIVRGKRGQHSSVLARLKRMGLRTVIIDGRRYGLRDVWISDMYRPHDIDVVVGEVDTTEREVLAETIKLGLGLGDQTIRVTGDGESAVYSERLFCVACGEGFEAIDTRLFSLNTPYGACETCAGRGTLDGDYARSCPSCNGSRLNRRARFVRIDGHSIADVMAWPVSETIERYKGTVLSGRDALVGNPLIAQIKKSLRFLVDVGLPYLSLDRRADTLSGGEIQRVRLAGQLGADLAGVCYVLDEPTIGLHPRDTQRLLAAFRQLRDLGNTVIVVEHDEDTILGADTVVDLGPGAGTAGGEVIAVCSPQALLLNDQSITGRSLRTETRGRKRPYNSVDLGASLYIHRARANNLRNISVPIPTEALVCVTGVSGSGKSTLVYDVLYQGVRAEKGLQAPFPCHDGIDNVALIERVVVVDQSPIGRTSRSTPATYVGLWSDVRAVYSLLPEARLRGFGPGRFSFNRKGGRCESCEGHGRIRIEMGFLPDVFTECDACQGKRYNEETLGVRYRDHSIADVLSLDVTSACEFFKDVPNVSTMLGLLNAIGLGYMRLGQPSVTLSGGEAQRIKLARELAKTRQNRILYILDEPTTGLHKSDVEMLVQALDRLVTKGNTVVVVEHNLDVIKEADYVIDLGPDGGAEGGNIVFTGTIPEILEKPQPGYTAQYVAAYLRRERHV